MIVRSRIWPNLELIRYFVVVLVTCKNEEDQIKNEGARVPTLNINFRCSRAANSVVNCGKCGRNSNSSKLLCMFSLPAKLKTIRSKTTEKTRQRHFPHYKSMGDFSDAQGQQTPKSVVESCRTSSSAKLSCMPLLPASIKKIG